MVFGLISELVGELLLQHGNEWLKDRERERERGGRKNFWTFSIPLQFAARSKLLGVGNSLHSEVVLQPSSFIPLKRC